MSQTPAPIFNALVRCEDLERGLQTMSSPDLVALLRELDAMHPNDLVIELGELARTVAVGRFMVEVELDENNRAEGGGETE